MTRSLYCRIMRTCSEVNCRVKKIFLWNPNLVETIELENLTDQVAADEAHESRLNAKHVEGHTGCVEVPKR